MGVGKWIAFIACKLNLTPCCKIRNLDGSKAIAFAESHLFHRCHSAGNGDGSYAASVESSFTYRRQAIRQQNYLERITTEERSISDRRTPNWNIHHREIAATIKRRSANRSHPLRNRYTDEIVKSVQESLLITQ